MQSPEIQNQNRKRDDKKNSKDPLADLPYWLQDFKENHQETELHASAHSSPESDLEHPTHSIYTHFPEDRHCDVCFENQKDKGSLQKTHWRSSTSSRKVW